jgi:hypothetical protein
MNTTEKLLALKAKIEVVAWSKCPQRESGPVALRKRLESGDLLLDDGQESVGFGLFGGHGSPPLICGTVETRRGKEIRAGAPSGALNLISHTTSRVKGSGRIQPWLADYEDSTGPDLPLNNKPGSARSAAIRQPQVSSRRSRGVVGGAIRWPRGRADRSNVLATGEGREVFRESVSAVRGISRTRPRVQGVGMLSLRDAWKQLLAKAKDDGLEHKRTIRVIYPTSDGREKLTTWQIRKAQMEAKRKQRQA